MNTFLRRILPILVIAGMLVSLTPVTARAQTPWFSIDPSSGPAGIGVSILDGGDFTPDQKGQVLWYDGSFLGDAYTDGKGTPSGSFYIPGDAEPGVYDVILDTGIEKAYSSFTVIATKPTDTPVPVPAPYIKDFSLDSQTILAGDCATLYWSVMNAQAVTLYGDFGSQSVDSSGSLKVCPQKTTTYEISADGYKDAEPPTVSASIVLTVTTIAIDTPTFTPSRTPTKFPGYIITHTFTPTFTPSRTLTKFPGNPNVPSFTPTFTPTATFLFASNNIAPMMPLFNNPDSPLGYLNHIQPGTPCSSFNLGYGAAVIGFDEAPSGRLTNRYGGITFGTDTAFVGVPSVATHSGNKAVSSYFSDLGSINHPILITFTYPTSAVGLYVGREAPSVNASEGIVALLTGYGTAAGGGSGIVAQSEIELPGEPTNIDRCLVIRAPAGQVIRTATLEFLNSAGHSVYDRRWMDDLTYLLATNNTPDLPPVVTITRPLNNAVITTESVNLQIDISEDIGLDTAHGVALYINGSTTPQYLTFVRDVTNPVHYQATTSLRDSLTRFSSNTVRVVATDTAGQTGDAQVTFTFQPANAVDIIIERIEVTQATQYMFDYDDNYMPIFTNKPTLVRVYAHILSGPATLSNLGGALCRGITDQAGCANPIRPFSSTQLQTVGGITLEGMRNDLNATLNFLAPMDWLRAGEPLRMTAYVNYNQENTPECCYENNFRSVGVDVYAGKTLDLILVPVNINDINVDYNLRWSIASGLMDVYPVSRVQLYRFPLGGLYNNNGFHLDFTGGSALNYFLNDGWPQVLQALSCIRSTLDYSTPYLRWYGMVPRAAIQDGAPGGMGNTPGYVSAGYFNTGNILGSQSVAAEEIGHNHGRSHASAFNGAASPDEHYPIGNGLLDQVGVNVRTRQLYLTTAGDYMSYNTPHSSRWTSSYTYGAMYRAVNSVAFNPFGSLHTARISLPETPTRYLTGAGIISPQNVQLTQNFFVITRTNPLWDELPAGPYTLELQDVSGNVLFSRGFGVPELDIAKPGDTGVFQFVAPWMEGTVAAVFKYNGTEIGRITASPNVPQVQVLSPQGGESWGPAEQQTITWTASDADGDPLSYLIQYSPDKGASWVPLAPEVEETSLTIDTANLPGGSYGIIRVLASDSFNTGEGYSNNPFTVAGKPPEVYISNPQENNELSPGWPVILLALGTDAEDGPLPAESLAWNSDRDGNVGTGDYLIASSQNMSVGEHTIILTGTDSTGQTATYTTHITVTAGYTPPEAKPLIPIWIIILAGIVVIAAIVVITTLVLLILRWKRKANPRG